jgi:hypothetical protein
MKTTLVSTQRISAPAGETSENMVALLAEYQFLYDSSLPDDIIALPTADCRSLPGAHRTGLALELRRCTLHAFSL